MKVIRIGSLCLMLSLSQLISCGESRKSSDERPKDDAQSAANHQNGTEALDTHSSEGTPSEKGLFLVKVDWQNDVLTAGTFDNSALVHFNNAAGEHVGATLKSFKLFMVSMGHGSIKENEMIFSQMDEAHWKVDSIYFSMGGPASSWAVDVEAEVNGQTDKARVIIGQEVK